MSRRIFISSASGALADYRQAAVEVCHRLGLEPVHMEEFSPGRLPPADECRRRLDGCDVFILLLAHRYGSRPEGERLSYTELEYTWAQDQPNMPILPFVVDPDALWPPRDIDHGNDGEALDSLIARVKSRHVVKQFAGLPRFREELLLALRHFVGPSTADLLRSDESGRRLPRRPRLHASPAYVGSAPFTGRRSDLAELDDWARSPDPVMVVEAIGGLGKSALTWHWALSCAPRTIPDLAGCVWWSFYEGSPSMSRFLREFALYASDLKPKEIGRLRWTELKAHVLDLLRNRPFLLVLDGFERLLHAYHRFDPSKLRDDEVEPAKRSMIDPIGEDLLRELTTAGPSKVLLSSRLLPTALSRFGGLNPGVRHMRLPGLTDEDTATLIERLGVRGTGPAIKGFFASLGNHPLLVGIVAGLVRDYRSGPCEFDRWLADPFAGGALALPDLNLTQRRTHILAAALAELSEGSQQVLGYLSVLSGAVDWVTLEAINPLRPSAHAQTSDETADAEATAGARLDVALQDLEDRGLLWWDRAANSYDLHPIIRAYVHARLENRVRVQANNAVQDYFQALPPEDPGQATTVEDLRQTITIFRALHGAGLHKDATKVWTRGLGHALLVQLAAYPTVVELMTPYADADSTDMRTDLTLAYLMQGRYNDAVRTQMGILAEDIRRRPQALLLSLALLGTIFKSSGAILLAARCEELRDLLLACLGEDPDQDAISTLRRAELALSAGDTERTTHLLDLADTISPPSTHPWHAGDLMLCRLRLLHAQVKLSHTDLDRAETSLSLPVHRMELTRLRALLYLRKGEFESSLTAVEQHDRLLRNTGLDGAPGLAALLLAKLGRHAAAADAVEETLIRLPRMHRIDRPYQYLAAALHELRRTDEAVPHALEAYRVAWCDGPPHHRHLEVAEAAELLTRLGETTPDLPVTHPASIGVPLEPEIRRTIRHFRL